MVKKKNIPGNLGCAVILLVVCVKMFCKNKDIKKCVLHTYIFCIDEMYCISSKTQSNVLRKQFYYKC